MVLIGANFEYWLETLVEKCVERSAEACGHFLSLLLFFLLFFLKLSEYFLLFCQFRKSENDVNWDKANKRVGMTE